MQTDSVLTHLCSFSLPMSPRLFNRHSFIQIGKLTKLTSFALGDNQITGPIPTGPFCWVNLAALRASTIWANPAASHVLREVLLPLPSLSHQPHQSCRPQPTTLHRVGILHEAYDAHA